MSKVFERINDDNWIISNRNGKNRIDPNRPYALLVEKERLASGIIDDVAIIFLTNMECPFHCIMCDLWKNTTSLPVTEGTIPMQIEWALQKLAPVKHVKLYNSGSFFDNRAVPVQDYERIAALLSSCETVIVESHPAFINENVLKFKNALIPDLEIAIGLELANDEILRNLNKKMTLDDFRNSVRFLIENGIKPRAFILLKPPFLEESEGVFWAKKSVDYAFTMGVECCTIIPVRSGNGTMDFLKKKGYFSLPSITSLEEVQEYGIKLKKGRVFADLWDLKLFSDCDRCFTSRLNRLNEMNLNQIVLSREICDCGAEV